MSRTRMARWMRAFAAPDDAGLYSQRAHIGVVHVVVFAWRSRRASHRITHDIVTQVVAQQTPLLHTRIALRTSERVAALARCASADARGITKVFVLLARGRALISPDDVVDVTRTTSPESQRV